MREQLPHGDGLLALCGELRPILRNRGIEVEQPALDQQTDRQSDRVLRDRERHHDRVGIQVRPTSGVQHESAVVVRGDLERQVGVAGKHVVQSVDDRGQAIIGAARRGAGERAEGHASTVHSTVSGRSATDAPARSV